ncbi:DUF1707 SHOCT-like domain-containing protein [Actinoalloteichus hymeniacidonis]|uniref:DUF1707 family protein n=1 Tax=Actinoalloteichus hymeniacidonis TaxID=340345 RepID=A0AAC9MWM2_9PSEU|nr:DUF1707 domain-containing protein [Actinoalloteichus hymeniacidonis]AOS61455.1 putative DUF1707 family protein [Actinoalloteichus hymeniacidonis]MBB5910539.1 hypothetical protein [Actinoalloteichus hymeniacidonis]
MTEPIRHQEMRASDRDRKKTQEHLHWAHAEGLIDLSEFDTRVRAAWDAKTGGELEKVTRDLPPVRQQQDGFDQSKPRKRVFSDDPGGMAMRVLTIIWLSATVVNLIVWGLIDLGSFELYPWWLWVGLPPGGVLGVLYASGIGRPRSE